MNRPERRTKDRTETLKEAMADLEICIADLFGDEDDLARSASREELVRLIETGDILAASAREELRRRGAAD